MVAPLLSSRRRRCSSSGSGSSGSNGISAFTFGVLLVTLLLCLGAVRAQGDRNLMAVLYNKVLEIAVPSAGPSTSLPPQIMLLEGAGISIRREDYDDAIWAQERFLKPMPKALMAQLVDRLPRYIGTSFVDSGSRISQMWNNLLHQYVVPVIDNPVVNQRVAEAKAMLANGTLDQAVFSAIDRLQAVYDEVNNNRDECLKRKDPDTCARNAVLWMEKRSRGWYNLELAKRQVERVDATLIALQTQDLKGLFASALQSFSTYQKVDIGAESFGTPFWDTTFTPSNWWRWFPLDKTAYNRIVTAGQPHTIALQPFSATLAPARIVSQPQHGTVVLFNVFTINNITYTPDASYTGFDSLSYIDNNSPNLVTVTFGVTGPDVLASNPAFISVSASSSEVTSPRTSVFNRLQVSEIGDFDNGLVRVAGGMDTSTIGNTATLTATATTISFEMAKVVINRPWLDTSLLQYYPVGLSGLPKNAWSDGSVFPNRKENTVQQIFKVLPTAMIIARRINIRSASLAANFGPTITSTSGNSNGRLQVGPFSISSGSASSANVAGDTISIPGPQIIAWIAAPLPAFPTASEDEVRAYERARSTPPTPTLTGAVNATVANATATNATAAATVAATTTTPTTSTTTTTTTTTGNGTNATNRTNSTNSTMQVV